VAGPPDDQERNGHCRNVCTRPRPDNVLETIQQIRATGLVDMLDATKSRKSSGTRRRHGSAPTTAGPCSSSSLVAPTHSPSPRTRPALPMPAERGAPVRWRHDRLRLGEPHRAGRREAAAVTQGITMINRERPATLEAPPLPVTNSGMSAAVVPTA
jgi:hypothetical protein